MPRILVVEDEAVIAQDLSDSLSELGYAVTAAVPSGEEAIAIAEKEAVNLAIVDIKLAGTMDGIQAAARLHASHSVPTVFLTVHSDDQVLRRVAATQPYGFILKPFETNELRCAVEIALASSALAAREREADRWVLATLEYRLRKATMQLEVQRLEHVKEMEDSNSEVAKISGGLAHSLRTPVRRLGAFCQALLEDYRPEFSSASYHHLQRIQAQSQRLAEFASGLDRLSRIARAELRPELVNLSQMVRSIGQKLALAYPERQVALEIQENVGVFADRRLMQTLMECLLENAWNFTATTAAAEVEFSAFDGDGLQICSVRDNGVGFEAGRVRNLFGMFERFHSGDSYTGTGVGLAVAQRIARRHGGRLWAESSPGRGATFRFALAVPAATVAVAD